jgi:hypothetical protein
LAIECSTRLIFVCIADEAEYLERTSKAEAAVTNSDNEQTRTLVGGVILSKEKKLKLCENCP